MAKRTTATQLRAFNALKEEERFDRHLMPFCMYPTYACGTAALGKMRCALAGSGHEPGTNAIVHENMPHRCTSVAVRLGHASCTSSVP